MNRRIYGLVAAGVLALAGGVAHGALAPAQEQQIHRLLDKVAASGCTFVRNGSDYTASEAASHLRMKLGKSKDRLDTVEQFIVHAASKSYLTGTPYQVRCPGKPVQTAQSWLENLQRK